MKPRPRDFFGLDDYVCGDPREQEIQVKEAQAKWDAERANLPWWKRIFA